MRWLAVLGCLAACGRFGFESTPVSGDARANDAPTSDARVTTGPIGPRWMATFTNEASNHATGTAGEVQVIARMNNPFSANPGGTLSKTAFIATALLRYDAMGNLLGSTVLDADGFCDLRGIGRDGPDLVLAGFTLGTTTNPALGACSLATGRQDPIAIRIDPSGNQSVEAHWLASTANAQGWRVAVMPDHSLTFTGIYGSGLQIGSYTMPAGITDPSLWVARTQLGMPTQAAWARGFTAGVEIYSGPIQSAGDEVCVTGGYRGNVTIFGHALPYVGGYDTYVARIDAGGTERFVRGFGSISNEPSSGEGSLLADADGGCTVGIYAPADLTIDGSPYPVADGIGMVVRFDAAGALAWARRFPNVPFLTRVGTRMLAAYTVTGTSMIGSTMYTADGTDTIVVELGATPAEDTLLGVVGGSGQQVASELATVGPDAVAVSFTTQGAYSFGATSGDTGATTVAAVGVLGI